MYKSLELQFNDTVAELKVDRPESRNSMNADFFNELEDAVDRAEGGRGVRSLIIYGAGKHFSAGLDLSMFKSEKLLATGDALERERFRRLVAKLQSTFDRLARSHLPVIAAVQGACIGAGLDLLCACDLRYATADAYFSIHEVKLGMMADLGTLQRLPKLLPDAVVRKMAFTGEPLSAAQAEKLGFVNEVLESAEAALEAARKTASMIGALAPLAVSASKEAINFARDHSVHESLQQCATWQAAIFERATVERSVVAQLSKQTADYPALLEALPVE